jgi:hypothetical protein
METGVEYNKATAAQGELLPGTVLREQGGSSQHTAAVEAQPGDDRALSKDLSMRQSGTSMDAPWNWRAL